MLVKISYHSIGYGGSMFATPDFTGSEVVEAESLEDEKLVAYIKKQKDDYGHPFDSPATAGYDFVSKQGGVKVAEYLEPIVKKLS